MAKLLRPDRGARSSSSHKRGVKPQTILQRIPPGLNGENNCGLEGRKEGEVSEVVVIIDSDRTFQGLRAFVSAAKLKNDPT